MKLEIKTFDELTTRELYELLKLRGEIFVVEQECAYPDCDGKDLDAWHLMLQENGELAAYLRILPEGSAFEETAIGRVMVRESQRGHGFAETILKAAMEFVWQQGKSAIRISAQQYLIDFYRGLGFQIVSDGYLEDGIPHIDMLCRREEGSASNAPS